MNEEALEYMERQAEQYDRISSRHNGACDDEAEYYDIAAEAIRWKMRAEHIFYAVVLIACFVAVMAVQIKWPVG